MQLYSYFRSSASYRVRIALALKKLGYDYLPVHLVKNEQLAPAFRAVAPSQLVPALVVDDAGSGAPATITQSLAIIEYLDETVPEPPLLPADALGRARVRTIALDIACEIHPLDNLRVLRYLQNELKVSDDDKNRWYRHWVETGLDVVERQLAGHPATGRFCHGDVPTMADVCLVPQMANAAKMSIDVSPYPTLARIDAECRRIPAFANAEPARQPDAE